MNVACAWAQARVLRVLEAISHPHLAHKLQPRVVLGEATFFREQDEYQSGGVSDEMPDHVRHDGYIDNNSNYTKK